MEIRMGKPGVGGDGPFHRPHGVCINSRGDIFVGGVSCTHTGGHRNPPGEIRSLQKLIKTG